MHRQESNTPHGKSPARQMTDEASLGRSLQRALVSGWETFIKSDKHRALRSFAALVSDSRNAGPDNRLRLPHPAYDVAALYIGIPFIEEIRARGFALDSWFPGDFERSEEVEIFDLDREDVGYARMGARAFRSSILRADGSVVCEIAITFPYLKDGFGFPRAPSLSMIFADVSKASVA